MRVLVALDPAFGARKSTVAADAFWFVESPENRAVAEAMWRTGKFDPNSAVFRGEKDEGTALYIFEVVDLHHPTWDVIEFVGLHLSATLLAGFSGAEDVSLTDTGDGFAVSRLPNP